MCISKHIRQRILLINEPEPETLCEKELQKQIQRWRYSQQSQLADPRNQKEEPETHHDVQDTQQSGWN